MRELDRKISEGAPAKTASSSPHSKASPSFLVRGSALSRTPLESECWHRFGIRAHHPLHKPDQSEQRHPEGLHCLQDQFWNEGEQKPQFCFAPPERRYPTPRRKPRPKCESPAHRMPGEASNSQENSEI